MESKKEKKKTINCNDDWWLKVETVFLVSHHRVGERRSAVPTYVTEWKDCESNKLPSRIQLFARSCLGGERRLSLAVCFPFVLCTDLTKAAESECLVWHIAGLYLYLYLAINIIVS